MLERCRRGGPAGPHAVVKLPGRRAAPGCVHAGTLPSGSAGTAEPSRRGLGWPPWAGPCRPCRQGKGLPGPPRLRPAGLAGDRVFESPLPCSGHGTARVSQIGSPCIPTRSPSGPASSPGPGRPAWARKGTARPDGGRLRWSLFVGARGGRSGGRACRAPGHERDETGPGSDGHGSSV